MKSKRHLIQLCLLAALLPALTSRAQTTVTQISAGFQHSLFLKSDGSLWAMGANNYGQLGDGTYRSTNRPEMIVSGNVTAIAAGWYHSLFLKSDGSLWAMGDNQYGELGDGNVNGNIQTNLPEMIVSSNVTAIAAGAYHSLFLKSDGSLWVMGENNYGQLGDGNYALDIDYANMNSPEMIVAGGVSSIAAGEYHSLFVKHYGLGTHQITALFAMGLNGSGQLGTGITNSPGQLGDSKPLLVVSNATGPLIIGIGGGSAHSLFFTTQNHLWYTGDNYDANDDLALSFADLYPGGVTAIAAGSFHSLFLKSGGSLWAMGNNVSGQLGDGTFNYNSGEMIVSSNVVAIAAGYDFSLFLKSDGSLWGMGDDESGQLANAGGSLPQLIATFPPPPLGITTYGNQPTVFFPTTPGTSFALQMTTNLASGNWVTVTNGTPISGVQITNAPGTAFFRLY